MKNEEMPEEAKNCENTQEAQHVVDEIIQPTEVNLLEMEKPTEQFTSPSEPTPSWPENENANPLEFSVQVQGNAPTEENSDPSIPARQISSKSNPYNEEAKNEVPTDSGLNLLDSPKPVKEAQPPKVEEEKPAVMEDVPLEETADVKVIKPKKNKSKPLPVQQPSPPKPEQPKQETPKVDTTKTD